MIKIGKMLFFLNFCSSKYPIKSIMVSAKKKKKIKQHEKEQQNQHAAAEDNESVD